MIEIVYLILTHYLIKLLINILIEEKFIHSVNRKSKDGISLFPNRQRTVYPDFYNINRRIGLDVKYKKLEKSKKGIGREDLYQMITYSYILEPKMLILTVK